MGALRLLYVDSAGVRRCRVLAFQGELPDPEDLPRSRPMSPPEAAGASAGGGGLPPLSPTPPSAQRAQLAPAAPGSGGLEATPSIMLAAAAGAIAAPAPGGARGSPSRLGPAGGALAPQSSLGALAPQSSLAVLVPQSSLGNPGAAAASLEATPSMALAAAAGAIGAPAGAAGSSGSRLLSPAASGSLQPQASAGAAGAAAAAGGRGNSSLEPTPSMALAAAAGAIGAPAGAAGSGSLQPQASAGVPGTAAAAGGGRGNSSLEPTPSMVLAAAAGAIPALHPPPATLATLTDAADANGRPPPQQQQQQPAQEPQPPQQPQPSLPPQVPLTKLVPAQSRSAPTSSGGAAGISRRGSALALSPLVQAAAAAALESAAQYSVGLTKAAMSHPAFADVVSDGSGLSVVGEVLLVPDLAAAVRLPWTPGHHMAPVDMMERDLSAPFACCPRSALKRALASLESKHGLQVMVGFELEFLLLKPAPAPLATAAFAAAAGGAAAPRPPGVFVCGAEAWVPVDSSVYDQTSSLDSCAPVLDAMVAQLEALGIRVLQFHAESAPGQFEIALHHFPALEAADKLVYARETISAVARQHGLVASFLPKPVPGAAGSGCHCHFSLWQGSSSIMAAAPAGGATAAAAGVPPTYHVLGPLANAFLAGVLGHLPGLLPFLTPSVNSYQRLQPCCWSGAFAAWGYDNREAPLRLCCPRGGPGNTNAELKAFDGATNPYIGLAALLAAGMLGLQEGASLPPPLQADPGDASAACSAAPLPASLDAALAALEQDGALQAGLGEVLGAELVRAFLAVRRCEAKAQPSVETLLLRY